MITVVTSQSRARSEWDDPIFKKDSFRHKVQIIEAGAKGMNLI